MSAKPPIQQMMLWADVVPSGNGSFVVVPRRPESEINTRKAAEILGVCRAQMWYLRNQPLGQKLLRWRFISERKGKILWELQSVLAYKEATKAIED